jgi:carboxyl-terminal processing protease
MHPRLIALLIILLSTQRGISQRPDSVQHYLDTAIHLFKTQSLYADKLDWQKIEDSVNLLSKNATTYKQADTALVWAFSQLKDKHGFVATKDSFYRYPDPIQRTFSKAILAEYQKPRSIKTMMLTEQIGYYKMPAVLIGSNAKKIKEWANNLTDSLCKLLEAKPKALILDLRMNNGGHSAPMFEAMKPLLGKSYKVYSANSRFAILPEEKDSATLADHLAAKPERPCTVVNPTIPIAVLIGPGTASSGEILAMAFASRPNTRLFGENSIGLCNATNGILLPVNEFYVLLSAYYMADHKKKINKEQVVKSQVYVKNDNDNYAEPLKDETVQAALEWLQKKDR